MKLFLLAMAYAVFMGIFGIVHHESGRKKGYDEGYKDGTSDSENK
jgi:hypothetical protein